jgi:para-aminobenzoate synthetase/4-amino-4-deoxychorismate lyase
LFDLEAHPSLWQMTSTVEAELAPEASFPGVLRATFPCGSITGAPKLRTMHWIRALETRPRGLYTGAIGWIDPPARGDFCLSVAIRTLTLEPLPVGVSPLAPRRGTLGIGAGIVSDSEAADEYAECQLKARFLTGLDPGFSLFETLYATRVEGIRHLERHLARLGHSAEVLGFDLPLASLRSALASATERLPLGEPYRLKLELHKDGRFTIRSTPLEPLPPGPVKLLIAPEPIDEADPLLGHKTSRRAHYDDAIATAVRQGAFDMLFRNRRGQLTEGARTNLFVHLDGVWLTPPLSAGVLPGVQRGLILDDPAWAVREAPFTLADLLRADQIRVTNALRGVLEARLEPRQAQSPRS